MRKDLAVTTLESAQAQPQPAGEEVESHLRDLLDAQRQAYFAEGAPSLEVRIDRLDRLAASVLNASDQMARAIRDDFGNRSLAASLAGDIATTIRDIEYSRSHLKKWMRPTRPQPGYFRLAGLNAWVEPQPLGVVGVIAPWNFPVALALQPAAAAIAAGNRVMIKMSELTPKTAEVVRAAIAAEFAPDEVVVITGDADVAAVFSALPFDHIFFTGAAAIGKHVQRAAAANLVPVTLELGGKNPAVVARDADISAAARRIIGARLANSGQLCQSPDYAFVPRSAQSAFVDAAVGYLNDRIPSVAGNPDYCTIINDRHFDRIVGLVADARERGAQVTEVIPVGESLPDPVTRTIPPTLLTGVSEDMHIMQEEVFGPVLAVMPYDDINEVIDYVNDHPTPLGSYWFGGNTAEFGIFRRRTRSGGVTRNDFALHCALDGLPFGGVGNSGTGYYHGRYGFDTFSHLRAVAEAPRRFSPVSILSPPFPSKMEAASRKFLGWQQRKFNKRLNRPSN
jgi:coniferyl-aldehyde dehydrogenase